MARQKKGKPIEAGDIHSVWNEQKTQVFSISLTETGRNRLDALAQRHNISRSECIERLIRGVMKPTLEEDDRHILLEQVEAPPTFAQVVTALGSFSKDQLVRIGKLCFDLLAKLP